MKYSIKKEFGTLEKDHDIVIKISLKKQGSRESYDDFHSNIIAMNSKLRDPMSEIQLMDIMKKNLNPGMRYILFNSEHAHLEDFRDTPRKAEKLLLENHFNFPLGTPSRNINELEIDNTDSDDIDVQVEAIQLSRKPDYSKILCWNCSSYGHSYIYCPSKTITLFCFKCGQRNFTTINCPNKHLGNLKTNENTIGDSCSSQ